MVSRFPPSSRYLLVNLTAGNLGLSQEISEYWKWNPNIEWRKNLLIVWILELPKFPPLDAIANHHKWNVGSSSSFINAPSSFIVRVYVRPCSSALHGLQSQCDWYFSLSHAWQNPNAHTMSLVVHAWCMWVLAWMYYAFAVVEWAVPPVLTFLWSRTVCHINFTSSNFLLMGAVLECCSCFLLANQLKHVIIKEFHCAFCLKFETCIITSFLKWP